MIEYSPPSGYFDLPYWYDFDTSRLNTVLASLSEYRGNVVPVSGQADFFILREVRFSACDAGGPFATSIITGSTVLATPSQGFQYYDALGRSAFSDLRSSPPKLNNTPGVAIIPVCPESAYPRRSSIRFDLVGLRQAWNGFSAPITTDTNSVPCGRIYFKGVLRRKGSAPAIPDGYWGSYAYVKTINVNWSYFNNSLSANGVAAPQRFVIPVAGWDFLLQFVSVLGDSGGSSAFNGGAARIKLYTADYTPISGNPVNLSAFNQLNQDGQDGSGNTQGVGSVTPPLLYPDQSVIQFDLQSLLSNRDTASQSVTLAFHGRRRLRRSGGG